MAKRIRLKFGMEAVQLRGIFHRKNCAVPFRHYRVTDAWKRHLLGSCIMFLHNTHLSVACPTWPHDPLSCVLMNAAYCWEDSNITMGSPFANVTLTHISSASVPNDWTSDALSSFLAHRKTPPLLSKRSLRKTLYSLWEKKFTRIICLVYLGFTPNDFIRLILCY